MGDARVAEETSTRRFREKRDAILAAAAEAINEQSAKGMTFADVARRVGLNTTSVTYYFKRKDQLAAGCFERTLHWLDERVRAAAAAGISPDPLSHAEVVAAGRAAADRCGRLVADVVRAIVEDAA